MKNKKGFVMTETLVVTVFLVSIFTFIYTSIVPLIGTYERMINRDSNIDIVYKLYHIRKMMTEDVSNVTKTVISGSTLYTVTCSTTYCNKLMEFLELDNYLLVYTPNIQDNLSKFNNNEMSEYISDYSALTGKILVLLDRNNHLIAHLDYYGA